jgi:hypothetical protein
LIADGIIRRSVSPLVRDFIQKEITTMLHKIRVVLAATLIALAGAATVDRVSAATAIEYGLIAAFIDP